MSHVNSHAPAVPMSISSQDGVCPEKGQTMQAPTAPTLTCPWHRAKVYMVFTRVLFLTWRMSSPAAAYLPACRSLPKVEHLTGPHGWRQGCWQEASPWLHLLVIGLSALGGVPPPRAPYLPSGELAVTIGDPAIAPGRLAQPTYITLHEGQADCLLDLAA